MSLFVACWFAAIGAFRSSLLFRLLDVVPSQVPQVKSDIPLRSHLVRPKDALEPTKQDGVVYKIPCECGKVYIGETGRAMQDRIKEHDRDIRPSRTQTSAVSEHANKTGHLPIWKEVKFIDRDSHG